MGSGVWILFLATIEMELHYAWCLSSSFTLENTFQHMLWLSLVRSKESKEALNKYINHSDFF